MLWRGSYSLVAALVLVACSGSGDEDTSLIRAALAPDVPVDVLLEVAEDDQIELFRDGVIDFADYERATFAQMKCLELAGIEILSPPKYDAAAQKFAFSYRTSDPMATGEISLSCLKKHSAYVQETWKYNHRASEAQKQASREALGDCLRDAGFSEIVGVPTDQQITTLLEGSDSQPATAKCIGDVFHETGVQPF